MNNRKFCGISLEEIKQYAVVASVLAAILFGGLYNPQVSQAGENLWMYTQGTDTRPKGSTELKWGTIGRFGKYSGDYSFYDHRPEIEYGITDKLTVSGELMIFSHNYSIEDAANAPVSETQSSAEDEGGSCISDPANQYDGCRFNRTSFGGYELGAKYNILSPYKDIIGATVAFGYEGRERYRLDGANIEQKSFTGKILLQKNWMDDRLVLAMNHKIELEKRKSPGMFEEEIGVDSSVGISYRYKPKHFVGFEVRRQADYLSPWNHEAGGPDDPNLEGSDWGFIDLDFGTNHQYGIYMGPSYHYAEKNWWVTSSILFQTWGGSGSHLAFLKDGLNYDEHETVHVGLTVGYEM